MYSNKVNINCKYFPVVLLVLLLSSCAIFKKGAPVKKDDVFSGGVFILPVKDTTIISKTVGGISKKNSPLQIKFGKQLLVAPDSIKNNKLYGFINNWLGIPYQWGGTNENGIDCSAFVQKLYRDVYDVSIPRTSLEQYYTEWVELYKNTSYLNEGDLIFFKTMKNNNAVTHVGFYLQNGYFVNASSSKGVSIAKIIDPYWKVKYRACGRLKSKFYAKR